jgi:hypothetical protein
MTQNARGIGNEVTEPHDEVTDALQWQFLS